MQKIVISLFLTCLSISFVTPASATSYLMYPKSSKGINLNVDQPPPAVPPHVKIDTPEVSTYSENEPGSGDEDGVDKLQLKPQFYYGKKDDDYNDRLDQHETAVKLNMQVPVDIGF